MQHKSIGSARNNSRYASSSHGWICGSQPVNWAWLGSVAARTEPGRPGSRSLSVGLFSRRLRWSSPVQYAMANMADITNSCSSPLAASGPTPSITQTAIPTQFYTRARSWDPWGTVEGGCSEGGGWMDADEGCELPRFILCWRTRSYLFSMMKKRGNNKNKYKTQQCVAPWQ